MKFCGFDTDHIWLIADTHFFHKNIQKYCERPEGWQDLIIENWNKLVKPEEIVFHLGDLAFGRKEQLRELMPRLNGKLLLIKGNHDRFSSSFYQSLGITIVEDEYCLASKTGVLFVFSHRPIIPLSEVCINFHGHIHNNPTKGITRCHINLCVEMCQYHPWKFSDDFLE